MDGSMIVGALPAPPIPPLAIGGPAGLSLGQPLAAAPERPVSASPIFCFQRGNLLLAQGKLDEAVTEYRRALALHPDFAEAHNNLGIALSRLGDPASAAFHYGRALEILPDIGQAHNNLGCALILLGELGAAIRHYKQAIALDPNAPSAYANLVLALHYVPGVSQALIAEAARRWAALIRRPNRPASWPNLAHGDRRIRIGYVSGDFRIHPVAYFFENVLAAHDRNTVEVFCYSNVAHADETTRRIEGIADHWRNIGALADGDATRLISADEVDILVDLSGHTAGNRLPLFANKPAPIQCTWLGYVGTTGLAEIDYIIADRFVLPQEDVGFYAEQPCRLPNSYLCFTPPKAKIAVGPLPALANGAVTFGCFNNLLKINDAVVELWTALLEAVPNSRLFLKTAQLANPEIRDSLGRIFGARGVARERLILSPASPREDLLAAYNEVDLALDPFPFGGGTTTLEALWMGVPVITLRGSHFAGRVGESILTSLGLSDLVADSVPDYLVKSIGLATSLPRLSALRLTLRDRLAASPLCDAAGFARDLEAAYRAMWQEWCRTRSVAA